MSLPRNLLLLFAKEYTHTVDVLPAHTEVDVSPVKIVLSTEFLFSLTERMVAQLSVELWCDDELISSDSTNIDLLAFDQWTGCFLMPEMIAAFVTPNHPTVSNMLSKASEYMAKWGKRPKITGYLTRRGITQNKIYNQRADRKQGWCKPCHGSCGNNCISGNHLYATVRLIQIFGG